MPDRNPRRWLILAVLCLSLLVVVIDNMVLNIAIPSLIRELGASAAEIQWIIDAYILVFAGLLLTAGSLSDRHGRRRGLVIGLIVFGSASVLATLCQTPDQLIAVRGMMGVGAAFLMPGTLSILTTVFDETERKKAIAIWSSVLMLGALGGPDRRRAAAAALLVGLGVPDEHPDRRARHRRGAGDHPGVPRPASRPDLVGALLSMIGMTALVWGVISVGQGRLVLGPDHRRVRGRRPRARRDSSLWERRVAEPMLPMKLFKDRNFAGASLSVVLLSFSAGGVILALTQYLQFVLGFEPIKAGFAFIPMIVTAMVFNGMGVIVDKKLGTRVGAGHRLPAAGRRLRGAGLDRPRATATSSWPSPWS